MAVYVTLVGGLANQMCQYAAAAKLAKSIGTEAICDLSFLDSQSEHQGFTVRKYGLRNLLNPPAESSFTPGTAQRLAWNCNEVPKAESHPDYALHGYFQTLSNLPRQSTIFQLLWPKSFPKHLADLILSRPSLAIHVRRGDYVSNPGANAYHGVLPLDYYRIALDAMPRIYTPFVFSDDPVWCREHITPLLSKFDKHYHVDDLTTDDYEQWSFMALMDAHIIANSSYSWLAALASMSSAVSYPAIWNAGGEPVYDRFPENWKKIDWNVNEASA